MRLVECLMLSASKALACVHTARRSETQKLCGNVCVCCLSVHVLRVSTALLSTVLVSYKSVVSFV